MGSPPVVGDIRFAAANPALRGKGLLGWVLCSYGGLQLDGLRVRRHDDGSHSIGFPTRTDANGVEHSVVRPLDQPTRDAIERRVLGELRRRGLLP